MLQYNIHLRTVNGFRNYANMIVRFNIAGFVRVRKEEINMYDILEMYCPASSTGSKRSA